MRVPREIQVFCLSVSATFLLLTACSSITGISHRAPASLLSAPANSVDGGALPIDETFSSSYLGNLTGSATSVSYFVQSYGGTKLTFNFQSFPGTPLSLSVSGPLMDLGGAPLSGNANPADVLRLGPARNPGSFVVLKTPGVYRVLVSGGAFSGKVSCSGSCSRPSIAASVFVENLKKSGQLNAFKQVIDAKLNSAVSDPTLRVALSNRLGLLLSQGNYKELDRFPALSLQELAALRVPLSAEENALPPSTPPPAPRPIQGDLVTLLGQCSADRSPAAPIAPSLPEVRYGDYNNMAMSDCQWDRSNKIADILSSLVADNGSVISYNGATIRTPADLIEALVKNGHRVEMRNERTYANFLSFTVGDPGDPNSKDVKWPTWINTGVQLKDGTDLTVPMGHSQHAWLITGPLVNARVTFFLGIYGTGFFAQTDVRPGWTGLRTLYSFSSDSPDQMHTITQALGFAQAYYKRNLTESGTIAKGMPADGYGFLGVCNDSTALLEYLYRGGQVTEYPLVRAKAIETEEAHFGDGLDGALAALPYDSSTPPSPAILDRIAYMTPYSLSSTEMIDDSLRDELKSLVQQYPALAAKIPN